MGAKRYCVVKDGELEITVAGVPKQKGSEVLVNDGGIEAFTFDYVFKNTGKTGAVYDDEIDKWIEIDGHRLHLTRNVTIVDMDYSMTITKDYYQLLWSLEEFIDKETYSDYNKKW